MLLRGGLGFEPRAEVEGGRTTPPRGGARVGPLVVEVRGGNVRGAGRRDLARTVGVRAGRGRGGRGGRRTLRFFILHLYHPPPAPTLPVTRTQESVPYTWK